MKEKRKFTLITTSGEISLDDRRRLNLLRRRFSEFWKNFEDLKSSGLNFNGQHVYDVKGQAKTLSSLGVSRYRVKGYLVDYRHFHAQGEPANFYGVVNLLKKSFRNPEAQSFLERVRDQWDEAGFLSGWHNNLPLDNIVDAVFKESIFHTHPTGQPMVRLADVEKVLSGDAIWFELTFMAYNRMLAIRNLNWSLDVIVDGGDELKVPV
ncbi:hypothetical protein LCM17_22270 [Cereibacter sphaeroides]|nr:hypothetical protein [Cereibacter sphaeroides]